MDKKKETFNYTYSASQQKEIRSIREKYMPPGQEEDKMEQLRRLDQSVTRPGTVVSLIVGIVGSLILGTGMCCTTVWADSYFITGIIVGIIGIICVIAAYPVYTLITRKQKEKLAPEIIRISDELMGQ
ncbi:MAG: hypothetical protein ACI4LD_10370 [Lentihominibacter sp.]